MSESGKEIYQEYINKFIFECETDQERIELNKRYMYTGDFKEDRFDDLSLELAGNEKSFIEIFDPDVFKYVKRVGGRA